MANRVILSLFTSIFLLAGCFPRSELMTYQTFDQIKTGMALSELEQENGRPYSHRVKSDGTEEYEYIERIDIGGALVAENHYFIIVKEGKVIGKYMTRQTPPAYDLIYQEEPNYPGYP